MIVLLSVIKTFDNCVILRQIYGLCVYLLMTSCQIVLHLEVFSFKTFINLFRLYNTLHTCLLTNLNKFFTFLDWSEVSTIIFLSMLKPCFHFTFKFCWDCFRVFSVLLWFYLVINRKLSTIGLLFALFASCTDILYV